MTGRLKVFCLNGIPRIWLNDQDLTDTCARVSIRLDAGRVPTAVIELPLPDLEVGVDAEVVLPEALEDLLLARENPDAQL